MACAKNAQQWGIAVCGGNGFLWGHSLFWKIQNSWLCEYVCGQTPTQGKAPCSGKWDPKTHKDENCTGALGAHICFVVFREC